MGLGGLPEGILRHSGDSPDVPLPSAMGLEINGGMAYNRCWCFRKAGQVTLLDQREGREGGKRGKRHLEDFASQRETSNKSWPRITLE